MMNGEARAFVMTIIKNPKATQHQKLDAIITLMLSDHDRLVAMEAVVDSHPFSRLRPGVQKFIWGFTGLWFVGVTWAFGDFIYEVLRKAGLV